MRSRGRSKIQIFIVNFLVAWETKYTKIVSKGEFHHQYFLARRGKRHEITRRTSSGIAATSSRLFRRPRAAERRHPRRCLFCRANHVHAHPWPWTLRHSISEKGSGTCSCRRQSAPASLGS